MAAIPQGVKPRIKSFARCYLSDLVKEINDFIDGNKNYTFIDITIYPKSVASGDATATVIYYCDESKDSSESPTKISQQ